MAETIRAASDRQVRLNLLSADAWDLYEEHRSRVTRLVLDAAPLDRSRLCVLGAGNANDLDIRTLLPRFAAIHLVDLDEHAIPRGLKAQQVRASDKLTVIGGLDVSGIGDWLERWHADRPSDEDVGSCLAAIFPKPTLDLEPSSYAVVLSATMLTQLVDALVAVLPRDHPRLLELTLASRDAHLRLIADLIAGGGTGILVTDVVSTDTCPQLLDARPDELPGLLWHLIAEQNFFTGTNPLAVASFLKSDPTLARSISRVEFQGPWAWRIGANRGYLTYALLLEKGMGRAKPRGGGDGSASRGAHDHR